MECDGKQLRKQARKSYEDNGKYLKSWEKEFPWLTSVLSEGSELAFCKLCRKALQTHRGTLVKHEQGAQHKKTVSSVSVSKTLNFPKKLKLSPVSDDVKWAELELALTICCHCSIQTIDHLGEVIKKHGKGSTLENIRRLHRTKCTTLIPSVLSPSLKAELKNDINGKKFSLMLDETTDVSVEKLLAICVRYYSEKSEKIMTAFLGLYPVVQATGVALFQAVKDSLSEYGLSLSNCIGIACDGAAVMVGENNSVWSRIKEESPKCILNKCVCHSLALCVQRSFETLPASLGFLLVEIPGWFSNSTLRRHTYKQLFEEMNDEQYEGECSNKNTVNMPFLKLSGTRWLVRGCVIKRLIENWNELKCYFRLAMQEWTQEVRYRARMIHDMHSDDINYLYFIFLSPLVSEFEKVNAFFQSTNADPETMSKELDIHYRGLKSRVFNKHDEMLSISMSDLGAHFMNELARCSRDNGSNMAFDTAVTGLKKHCQDFLFYLIKEVEKRLPANKNIFQDISGLHLSKMLPQTARFPFSQLPQHL